VAGCNTRGGTNERSLDNFYNAIKNHPVSSALIIKNGSVIFQYFDDGYNENSIFAMNSCAKSITSALVGIAIDRGYIEGVDTKIETYFPQLNYFEDERSEITVRLFVVG